MIKIGITGGIGSGKSMIANFFGLMGVPVFKADEEAKRIINNSSIVRSRMVLTFGEDIYLPNQSIDRKKLAGIIFNSPSSLEKVNAIVHPEVRKAFNEWTEKQNSAYVVYEAAILFESGYSKDMDLMVLVTAPKELRVERVMKRDNVSREDVEARIERQWDDAKKIKLSNLVLINDNKELLIPQLIELDINLRRHG